MKKFTRNIALFVALLTAALALVSCGGYDFYQDWVEVGATIDTDNVFKALTLDEVKEKRDNNETFALIVASSTDSNAVSAITKIQEQADYVGFDEKVFFISSKDVYNASRDTQKEFRDKVGISDFRSQSSSNPLFVLIAFKNGSIIGDTSKSNYSGFDGFLSMEEDSKEINYELLAHYLFTFDNLYN